MRTRKELTTLVSASVADEARAEFELRPVDRIVVRGKTAPVDVFELTGPRNTGAHEPSPPFRGMLSHPERAIERQPE